MNKTKVNLREIIETMEIQVDDIHTYLNTRTGEIVNVSREALRDAEDDEPFDHLPEWQQNERKVAIDVLDNEEDYKELPTKYELNEYEIMEDFCFSIQNERVQERLLNCIRGKGAFRRFEDQIIELDIEDQWFSYREESFKQIAIRWCEENDIDCVE